MTPIGTSTPNAPQWRVRAERILRRPVPFYLDRAPPGVTIDSTARLMGAALAGGYMVRLRARRRHVQPALDPRVPDVGRTGFGPLGYQVDGTIDSAESASGRLIRSRYRRAGLARERQRLLQDLCCVAFHNTVLAMFRGCRRAVGNGPRSRFACELSLSPLDAVRILESEEKRGNADAGAAFPLAT